MTGYLQRLFDRTVPASTSLAQVVPAGISLSPVADADQRLNDPAIAGQFGFITLAEQAEESTVAEELLSPYPLRSQFLPPSYQSSVKEPSTATSAQVAAASTSAAVPLEMINFTPPFMSSISPEDLLLPDVSDSTTPLPSEPPRFPKSEGVEPPPLRPHFPELQARRLVSEPIQKVSVALDPATAAPVIEPTRPIPAIQVADPVPSVANREQIKKPAKKPAGLSWNVALTSELRNPTELMPPPVSMPPLPGSMEPDTNALSSSQPIKAAEKAARQSRRPTALPISEASRSPLSDTATEIFRSSVTDEARRSPRPMTAAAASVIGPLAPRRRAVTLFGLRRR
ncbi:hypothetical protein [Nitrosospira sp. Nsp13]|uniref:hypothetical protein n=1 Tax=Nitrosospira sp. Nsp13 TaxID=1855332 RepID=UPI000888CA4E|nr:hypothetical protein [Nitrosospira sp. Nsp13]SCX79601.1 hypothetical protein SAMN05216308_101279 [Nitrosospira sp. Nsp13]